MKIMIYMETRVSVLTALTKQYFLEANIVCAFLIVMSYHTNTLVNRRSNYRTYGWLLTLVGLAGLLFVGYIGVRTLLTPLRRRSFDLAQSNDIYLLVENGEPTAFLFGIGIAFVVFVGAGNWLLSMARGITRELKATQAEVSRRIRVEEALREQGRSHA